jgi:hypothetical protein
LHRGVKPPALLAEPLAQAAHLGGEGHAFALDLAERSVGEQHAQIRRAPVDEPERNRRRVVQAGGEIVFVERVVRQRAGEFRTVDREPELLRRFARRQPRAGAAGHAAKHDIFVVIGEALHRAVVARDGPAAAQGCDAFVEFGLQGRRDGAHLSSFTLPWRGRVDCLSEATTGGVG